MDILSQVSAEMVAQIVLAVEFLKKVFPVKNDYVKLAMPLVVGAIMGYVGFVNGVFTDIYVAIGVGLFAGGEAAGLWKIVHEVGINARKYVAESIKK